MLNPYVVHRKSAVNHEKEDFKTTFTYHEHKHHIPIGTVIVYKEVY